MGEVAYKVKAELGAVEFGVVAVGEGDTFDIGAALEDGHGYVVAEQDSHVAIRLAENGGLELCDVDVARKAKRAAAAAAKSEKKEG